MSMGQAVKSVLSNYANFSGRARRSEYWWWMLAVFLVSLIPSIFMGIGAGQMATSSGTSLPGIYVFGLILSILIGLAVLIPGIAVAVRRLHDQNKSGAFYLVVFIPFIGAIWLLILMLLEGTRGPNQYGSDPKGR